MIDAVFKALSDPNRRRILSLLKKSDLSVGEIRKHFAFTGATLSHHLDALKKADLVIAERRGQFIYYSLNMSVVDELIHAFSSLFS